ncbi:MAG: mechanosensitive ion channel [bacterium]|nr:mechanosensitive ion channel [bacterium]
MNLTRAGAFVYSLVAAAAANDIIRHGFTIAIIVIAVILTSRFAHRAIERMVRHAITPTHFDSADAERKREDTLIRIIDGVFRVVAWFIAIFFLLKELGMNTTPFVTAAGVLGLAVSIGGQHFTRDVIAGICLTVEDQYRVGDTIRINGITGVVQSITLRITIIRDVEGVDHYFPNGTIVTVANLRDTAKPRPVGPPAP